jgi:hypothetical protein
MRLDWAALVCRGVVPTKLQAGHYAAVHGDELWVFPGPRNHNMRRVFCLDMLRYRHCALSPPPAPRPYSLPEL